MEGVSLGPRRRVVVGDVAAAGTFEVSPWVCCDLVGTPVSGAPVGGVLPGLLTTDEQPVSATQATSTNGA